MTPDKPQDGAQAAATDPNAAKSTPRKEGATLGANTRIKGELQADEDLLIEGSFDGTLVLRKHLLVIGPRGRVKGSALANSVNIEGHLEGDVYASERISIRKGAQVKGTVMAPRVSLEDGGRLTGTVEMDADAIRQAVQSAFGEAEKLKPAPAPEAQKPATPAAAPSRPAASEAPRPEVAKREESSADTPRPAASAAAASR